MIKTIDRYIVCCDDCGTRMSDKTYKIEQGAMKGYLRLLKEDVLKENLLCEACKRQLKIKFKKR